MKGAVKKIGNVSVIDFDADSKSYADGSEERLLEIFSSASPQEKIDPIIEAQSPWEMYYHLSPARKNVVSWIDFEEGASVLEVGSGCGSITEALIQKNITVHANDISMQRSVVNATRNKSASNLTIFVGNLSKLKPKKLYDYVVCVGVLEYAGSFIDSTQPYDEFLSLLKSFLKPDGKLVLAIENRFGFKYFAGAKEDHTGKYFDSINDYFATTKQVRTFGRAELDSLLEKYFLHRKFFYPYPDYKLPELIHSDEYMPGAHTDFPLSRLPTKTLDQNRLHILDEAMFVKNLERNGLYRDFSNSFIVIAGGGDSVQPCYVQFQNYRHNSNKTITKIPAGKKIVTKEPAETLALTHIKQTLKNSTVVKGMLKDTGFSTVETSIDTTNKLTSPLLKGRTLEAVFMSHYLEGDFSKARVLLEEYLARFDTIRSRLINPTESKQYVDVFGSAYDYKTECMPGIIDLTFDNIIIDANDSTKWTYIDYEWIYEFYIPKEYIIGRVIYWEFFVRYKDLITKSTLRYAANNSQECQGLRLEKSIHELIIKRINKNQFSRIIDTETAFQSSIARKHTLPAKHSQMRSYETIGSLISSLELKDQAIKELQTQVNRLNEELCERIQAVDAIHSSKAYKVTKKIQNASKKLRGR